MNPMWLSDNVAAAIPEGGEKFPGIAHHAEVSFLKNSLMGCRLAIRVLEGVFMQLDLALYLRLSRSLETSHLQGQVSAEEYAEVLGSLDRLLFAVNERLELLATREAVTVGTEAVEVEALDQAGQIAVAEVVEEEAPPQVWTAQHDLLYEDVLWLFRIGDNEGALESLGRLLDLAGETQELKRFLEINRAKLLAVFERILGDFNQPLEVSGNGLGDRYFWNVEEAEAVLRLARECGSIAALLEKSYLGDIKTLCLLHRMQVDGMLSFPQKESQTQRTAG